MNEKMRRAASEATMVDQGLLAAAGFYSGLYEKIKKVSIKREEGR